MKRFTMDEIIARRKEKTTQNNGNVGNLSETCRKQIYPPCKNSVLYVAKGKRIQEFG